MEHDKTEMTVKKAWENSSEFISSFFRLLLLNSRYIFKLSACCSTRSGLPGQGGRKDCANWIFCFVLLFLFLPRLKSRILKGSRLYTWGPSDSSRAWSGRCNTEIRRSSTTKKREATFQIWGREELERKSRTIHTGNWQAFIFKEFNNKRIKKTPEKRWTTDWLRGHVQQQLPVSKKKKEKKNLVLHKRFLGHPPPTQLKKREGTRMKRSLYKREMSIPFFFINTKKIWIFYFFFKLHRKKRGECLKKLKEEKNAR